MDAFGHLNIRQPQYRALNNMKTSFIPDTNDRYLAYEDGRIFDTKRNVFVAQNMSKRGWLKCHIWKGGKRITCHVHRLIMMAFCGKSTLTVNHKDGNKSNNHLDNLEYMSVQEQNRHRSYVLKRGNRRKVRCLENGKVYETICEAGKDLGIPHDHISRVCKHKYGYKSTHGFRFEYVV